MTVEDSHSKYLREADQWIAQGEPARAIICLKQALKLNPQAYERWILLSRLLYEGRQYSEAINAANTAEQFDPLQPAFRDIQKAIQVRRFESAKTVADRMLEQVPGHSRALFTLAHVAQARGDHELRARWLEQGLSQSPANLGLRMALFSAYEDSGAIQNAIETATHIAEIEPSFETISTLTGILFRYGQNDAALAACERTEPLCNGDPLKLSEVQLIRAQLLRILGAREDSIAMFRASLAQNPNNAVAWWGLADMKTFSFSADDRIAIQALIAAPNIRPEHKCPAAFALAKASEAAGDWDAAMTRYQAANALRTDQRFNPETFQAGIERVTGQLGAAQLSRQASPSPSGPRPIFILGLPRSGSTLIEQILASHSEIEGTIEQPVMPNTKRKAHALCVQSYGGDYLSHIGAVSEQDLSEIGQFYLDQGRLFRTGATPFFTDKLPFNFEHVGLIHKILPEAVIIDARRNPLDCGFSLFKQYFAQGSDFSYSLDHIGVFYNGYLKLMDHWDTVLPGRVLRVAYEDLVRAPEPQIRRLLEHVGVDFEPACLNFHETDRAVRTASSEQVRQPINTRGIGAWRKVERHLQPLKARLGAQTLARFDGRFDP